MAVSSFAKVAASETRMGIVAVVIFNASMFQYFAIACSCKCFGAQMLHDQVYMVDPCSHFVPLRVSIIKNEVGMDFDVLHNVFLEGEHQNTHLPCSLSLCQSVKCPSSALSICG